MSKEKRFVSECLKLPYARILIPEDDGTYSAEILEFPGCFAEGNTPDEAISNLNNAAESWIEAALEQGQEIPEPHASHGYSGKTNLRLPRSIHKKAAQFAQRDDVSLNAFFACAVAARVGAEEFYSHLVARLEEQLQRSSQCYISAKNIYSASLFFLNEDVKGFQYYQPTSETSHVLDIPTDMSIDIKQLPETRAKIRHERIKDNA